MPKKKQPESEAQQSERFRRDAQAMIDAGELSPIDAENALEAILSKEARRGKSSAS